MEENLRTVLVVEDSGDDAALIRTALQKAGLEHVVQTRTVEEPNEGRQYLMGEGQYADRTQFPKANLLLLDHQMPGDGMELLRWTRGQPSLAGLRIVIFSGSNNPQHRQSSLDAGANAYYIKPNDFHDFVASVKSIIETWLPG